MNRTVALTLGICLLAASAAQATTVRIDHIGYGHVGTTGVIVDYDWDGHYDAYSGDYIKTGQYKFAFYAAHSSPGTADLVTDPFFAYCVDLDQSIPYGWADYSLVDLEDAPLAWRPDDPMGTDKANDLRELWGRFAGMVTSSATGEAFGAAVWEIVFENPANDYDVADGALKMTGMGIYGGENSAAIANDWLSQLNGDISKYEQGLFALSHPCYQDFALAGPTPPSGNPIPEPMTLAGVGMGVAGLCGYLRRRRQAQA